MTITLDTLNLSYGLKIEPEKNVVKLIFVKNLFKFFTKTYLIFFTKTYLKTSYTKLNKMENMSLKEKLRFKLCGKRMARLPNNIKEVIIEDAKNKMSEMMDSFKLDTKPPA